MDIPKRSSNDLNRLRQHWRLLGTANGTDEIRNTVEYFWKQQLKFMLKIFLNTQFCKTHDHSLLFQIRVFPNLEVRSQYLCPLGTEWPSYTPSHWVPFPSPFTTSRATVEVTRTRLLNLEGQSAVPWRINSRWTEYKTAPPLFAFEFVAAQAWTGVSC
jgi:hypothetical protein